MAASTLNSLCSGVGLIYATDSAGTTFYIPGVANNAEGLEIIKRDAAIRAGEGFETAGVGSYEFTAIGGADTIINFTINGVSQYDVAVPIAVSLGDLTGAAQDLADAINAFTPASGVNYRAYAVGATTYFEAVEGGSAYNGHAVVLTQSVGNITGTATAVANGADGGELISTCIGRKYWLNADAGATAGSIVGADEITEYVVGRYMNSALPTFAQTISSTSITSIPRYSAVQVIELGAGGATDLDSIQGEFSLYDIIVLHNKSSFTITVNDLSVASGNIQLGTTDFAMTNDDYILGLQYVNDATNGNVLKEIWRTPNNLGTDSVTDVELADNAVDTAAIQNLAVTTAKIAAANITNSLMAANAIGTSNIIDLNVTTAKIADLNVTNGKIALLAVDTAQLADLAVETAKIADSNVTVAKLEDGAKTHTLHAVCSFETGYTGQVKIEVPWACEVIKVSAAVTFLIEATDDATIVSKNHAGTAMTAGQVDLTAASPIGNVFTASPTGNNTFAANENIILETSKVTAGGQALVTVHAKLT